MGIALALVGLALAGAAPAVRSKGPQRQTPSRAYLGILVEPTPAEAARPGVIVRAVAPDSPAAKAELKSGDVITKIGKKGVRDFDGLVGLVSRHKVGDKLTVHVLRDGKERELIVILAQRPGGPVTAEGAAPPARPMAHLGVQTQPVTPQTRSRLGVAADRGALVVEVYPDTPAAKAGLKRGDVIVRLDNQEIADPLQLRQAVQKAGSGKKVEVTVLRGQERKTLTARLEDLPIEGLGVLPPSRLPPGGGPPALRPAPGTQQRLLQLERRVDELEKQLRQLQEKSGKAPLEK
jgi:S1-C subfamily serine protease